jgi:hypothetical protein
MLKGAELLAKVKELGDAPKCELVRACGYVVKDRVAFTQFYEALLEAKGLDLNGKTAKRGRGLTYKAKVHQDTRQQHYADCCLNCTYDCGAVMYTGFNAYDRPIAQRRVTRVQDANTAWYAQEAHWILIEDLLQGTYGMRRKHRRYLPQEPRELDESYDNRLARSVCPPFYQRLERMLAGMLTRKPVRLDDTADVIREQLFDVDLQGNDLNVWTYETTRKMVRYGHVGVLVDAPADGGRPYWVTYTPRQILGWRAEQQEGRQVLTQLRLAEMVTVPDGEFGEKAVEQI